MDEKEFKAKQAEAIQAEAAIEDTSRFDNWGSKPEAAKAAGVERPTIDAWIRTGKIPASCVRTKKVGKMTRYQINISEVARIANADRSSGPAAEKRLQEERIRFLEQQLTNAERDRRSFEDQLEMANAQLLRIEHQTEERMRELQAAKDEAIGHVKEGAKSAEIILREQLEKAEAEIQKARDAAASAEKDLMAERSKGVLAKLFGQ